MRVRVRVFAGLRERAGAGELELDVPPQATVGDVLQELTELTGDLPVVMAVNRAYADVDQRLQAGDELALIPPVAGGAGTSPVSGGAQVHARVVAEPLSLDRLHALVRDPRAGAVTSFLGVTRDVEALEYEAYTEMAEPVLHEIASAAAHRHGLCAVAVEHRVGKVPLSEASVAIAVSSPHRAEAFAGAREIIDELKARAPIWKREEGEWIEGAVPR